MKKQSMRIKMRNGATAKRRGKLRRGWTRGKPDRNVGDTFNLGLEKATPGNGASTPTPMTGAPRASGRVGQWERPTDLSGRRKYLEVKEQHGAVTLPTGGGA